ncbi:hypothetical protein KY363_03645 [Candidatus Woesearchaeota archaeon]|nr:hypothetical protein [Candidatus Woesearchaeota archaeon]
MHKKSVPYLIVVLLLVSSVAAYDQYIAGGYISADSSDFIQILNPSGSDADASVTFVFEKNESVEQDVRIDAYSTLSVDVSRLVSGSFGAIVSSDAALVVDSVQFDTSYSGGFGSAAAQPAFVWYFPEGYNTGMAKTYLYILNPNSRASTVGITLYYDSGERKTFSEEVPARRSLRLDLKERSLPEKRFGMKVTGTAPIVVSSGYLNKRFSGGAGGHGATSLSKKWVFPDGYTSTDATEFLNVLNPSLEAAHVNVTLYYSDGTKVSFDETAASGSKSMYLLNNYATEYKWYSTVVESDVDVAVQRTHFDQAYSSGHGGVGAVSPADFVYFAYAVAGDDVTSRLSVFNPSSKDAELDITLFYADGSVKSLQQTASSMRRSTVDLNKEAVQGKPFGLSVSSSVPVFSEIVVDSKAFSSGHGYVGVQAEPVSESVEAVSADEVSGDDAAVSDDVSSPLAPSYLLVGTEDVPVSKLGAAVGEGLVSVTKDSYDYSGEPVLVWHFMYSDERAASAALAGVLSGGLFTLLEVTPETISGAAVHSFASEKSEGYIWQNSSDIYMFLAGNGQREVASGLAVSVVVPAERSGFSLWSILLILVGLILLVVVIRWLFRKGPDEDDSIEGMLHSAEPKNLKKAAPKPVKKAPEKKEAKQEKKGPAARKSQEKKEPEKKEAKQERQQEEKKPEKKEEKQQEEKKPEKKEAEKRPAQKKPSEMKNVTIREIPRNGPTAQDILDELEEIPEYEDVFRHVNRDQEEIKPK